MPTIIFTNNLKRHLNCDSQQIDGETLAEVMSNLVATNAQLGGYIVDDQGRLRKHILVSIDNEIVKDRSHLTEVVQSDSEIYILQALSGG